MGVGPQETGAESHAIIIIVFEDYISSQGVDSKETSRPGGHRIAGMQPEGYGAIRSSLEGGEAVSFVLAGTE